MTRYSSIVFCLTLVFVSCQPQNDGASSDNWKNEIREAENAFAEMVKNEGMSKAFLDFAAEDAVLNRNNSLISGKSEIKSYFEKSGQDESAVSLTWEPDFIDVAGSGDLAYTYGPYVFSVTDSTGVKRESKGIYHTVWKRQENGEWRFVWD